jgi:hypothetical protein
MRGHGKAKRIAHHDQVNAVVEPHLQSNFGHRITHPRKSIVSREQDGCSCLGIGR